MAAASPPAGEESSDSLVRTLELLKRSKNYLRELYENGEEYFKKVEKVVESSGNTDKLTFLNEHERFRIERILKKDPMVVVTGQMNCGKTSLINTLLGYEFFPERAIPNTARLVKIRYSENDIIKITKPDGQICEYKFTDDRKVPKDLIALEDESRDSDEAIRTTVEIGLNHDLLKDGLILVDVPGLSENEVLDALIRECMDGVLQIIVYVIDGKYGLKLADENFLVDLRKKTHNLDIIYVCNKADLDKEAEKMNQYDDPDGDQPPIKDEKTKIEEMYAATVKKLKKCHLIRNQSRCHHISCKKVKRARNRNRCNEFTHNFDHLLDTLSKEFVKCIRGEIRAATKSILQAQMLIYNLIFNESEAREKNKIAFVDALINEDKLYVKMKNETKLLQPKIERLLKECIDRDALEQSARDLEISSRNKEEWYKKMSDLVVTTLLETSVETVLDKVFEIMMEFCDKKTRISITSKIYVLHCCMNWQVLTCDEEPDKPSLPDEMRRECREKITRQLDTDIFHNKTQRAGRLDSAWKGNVALDMLTYIDYPEMAQKIIETYHLLLEDVHRHFMSTLGFVGVLLTICEGRPLAKELLCDTKFARDCYVAKALLRTITEGHVQLGEKEWSGSTADMYKVKTDEGEVDDEVAKKFRDGKLPLDVCVRHSYISLGDELPGLVEMRRVCFDTDWTPVFIMKKYRCRLDEALSDGIDDQPVSKRLHALLTGCKAIDALLSKRIHFDILNAKSFLVEDQPGDFVLALNLIKTGAARGLDEENNNTLAVQLTKLLVVLVMGSYDQGLTEMSSKDDLFDHISNHHRIDSSPSEKIKSVVEGYFYSNENLTIDSFMKDLQELVEMAKRSERMSNRWFTS